MKKGIKIVSLALIAIVLVGFVAKKGQMFPTMETETIDDKKVTIPSSTKGKHTLIGLAYSKKAEQSLNTWYQPLYMQLLHKPENPGLFATDPYDINLYFVPMFSGLNQAAAGTFKKKIKKEVDQKWQDRILVFKGKVKPYTSALGLKDKNSAYVYLLDETGKIVYETSGDYTESKIVQIENILDEAAE